MPPKAKSPAGKKDKSPVKKDKKPSPPKKNSPQKGKKPSPKKNGDVDEAEDPTKEVGIQTEYTNICIFCYKTFHSPVNIQSHLLTMDHFIPEAPIQQRCKVCRLYIHIKDVENHICCKNKAVFLDQILATNSIFQGPPNICIYCNGLRFTSKVQLIVHLLCVHSNHKEDLTCGLCSFQHEPLNEPGQTQQQDKKQQKQPKQQDQQKQAKQQEQKQAKQQEQKQPKQQQQQQQDQQQQVEEVKALDAIPMNQDFQDHISKTHEFGFEMAMKKAISEESMLRYPYACPFCKEVLKTNAEFHCHIVGRHAVSQRFQEDLLECLYCKKPKWKPEVLNLHLVVTHTQKLRSLGERLVNAASMMNFVELSTTCTICWKVFTHDFYLQNHIIVNHILADPYKCGWCQLDFRLIGDCKTTARAMHRHELKHAREVHERAIEFKITIDPLPPEVPNEMDEEEENKGEQAQKKGSPKGGKKDSPNKGGKNNKNSPPKDKNKKPSPPKGKKEEGKKGGKK